jgi:hypothetical protein
MKIHELKTWPEFFQPLVKGLKFFELRKNDRNFQIADILVLKEWIPRMEVYTGESVVMEITSMVIGDEIGKGVLAEGYCILGVRPLEAFRNQALDNYLRIKQQLASKTVNLPSNIRFILIHKNEAYREILGIDEDGNRGL